MQTIKILFLLISLCSLAQVNAQEVSTTPAKAFGSMADWAKLTPLERHKRGVDADIKSRKIELKVIPQTHGVKSGLVIAYGHVIQPPYKVYTEDDRIMVNGVQVSPSLIWQREVSKYSGKLTPVDKERYKRALAVTKQANVIFCDLKDSKPNEEVAATILSFVKKSTDIVIEAHWTDVFPKGSLQFQWVGDAGPDVIDFRNSSCQIIVSKLHWLGKLFEQSPKKRHKQILEDYVKGIIKRLNMGQIMIFSSHGEGDLRWDKRDDVNKIMGTKELSENDKVEALHKLGFGYSGALDIIENYNPEEWKVQK